MSPGRAHPLVHGMRGSLLALMLSSAIALPSPVFAAPAPAPRDLPSPTTAGALAIGLSLGSIGLMQPEGSSPKITRH